MKSRLLMLMLAVLALSPCLAQNSKKVKNMKNQKQQLQQTLKKSQRDLDNTRKQVKKGQQNIVTLDREINMRVEFIRRTEREIDSLDHMVDSVKEEVKAREAIIKEKKEKYIRSLRMAQTYRQVNSSLLFAFSAKDLAQMYRRLRYTREYASYERNLGEQVQAEQMKLLEQQALLLRLKDEVAVKMRALIAERAKLSRMQAEEQRNVTSLQKKEKGLQKQVKDQNAQIIALQKKIDQQIAYEIEQARKKAEEEARRKAAEEAKRKAAEEAKRKAATASSGKSKSSSNSSTGTASKTTSTSKWLTAEDQKLNGSLESNKGRLPVPITGQYMIGAGYGANVSGQKNVTLKNKGVNYVGKAGARARAIFDGEVSSVISLSGMKHVLVRHGSYISVYCNLSSVIVAKGQKVKARDLLGTVANDGSGNYTLHFQLRKETAVLNPSSWIGR